MKTIKKIAKYIGILLLLLLLSGGIYLYNVGPTLPDNTDLILDEVMTNPLPELVEGAPKYGMKTYCQKKHQKALSYSSWAYPMTL